MDIIRIANNAKAHGGDICDPITTNKLSRTYFVLEMDHNFVIGTPIPARDCEFNEEECHGETISGYTDDFDHIAKALAS